MNELQLIILKRSGTIDMDRISNMLKKPLRPLWYTPQSSIFINDLPNFEEMPFYPVICLSASQAVESGCQARPGYLYVQGSGDDQEAWCHVSHCLLLLMIGRLMHWNRD